jgi:hypothetical protein
VSQSVERDYVLRYFGYIDKVRRERERERERFGNY